MLFAILSCSVYYQAIEEDMVRRTRPMDRLVCGDVGFGKTEIAMRAIYRAVLSNRQVFIVVFYFYSIHENLIAVIILKFY